MKQKELDPYEDKKWVKERKNKEGVSRSSPARLSPLVAELYRLAPTDGLPEFKLIVSSVVLWVPEIPVGMTELSGKPLTWREWLFQTARGTGVRACHRTQNEMFQVLRRMAHWPGLTTDVDRVYAGCAIFLQFRSQPAQGLYRSFLADDSNSVTMPLQDVAIDAQAPFTKAERGRAVRVGRLLYPAEGSLFSKC